MVIIREFYGNYIRILSEFYDTVVKSQVLRVIDVSILWFCIYCTHYT